MHFTENETDSIYKPPACGSRFVQYILMFTINERAKKTNIRGKFDDKLNSFEVIIDFNYSKLYK